MYKILVCGSRHWNDWEKMKTRLDLFGPDISLILGDAKGADLMAEQYARGHKIPFMVFYADWKRQGLAAGPIRNRKMLDEKPDLILAFHENIAASKGTKDCVNEAARRGFHVEIVT